jgi:hypothetical protein
MLECQRQLLYSESIQLTAVHYHELIVRYPWNMYLVLCPPHLSPISFPPLHIYTFEELKRHACRFILSKWQSFTDLNGTIRAISNLQWSKPPIYISPSRLCRDAEYNKGGLSVTK